MLLTTSATQAGGSAPPEKDAMSWCVMGWAWYKMHELPVISFDVRLAGTHALCAALTAYCSKSRSIADGLLGGGYHCSDPQIYVDAGMVAVIDFDSGIHQPLRVIGPFTPQRIDIGGNVGCERKPDEMGTQQVPLIVFKRLQRGAISVSLS